MANKHVQNSIMFMLMRLHNQICNEPIEGHRLFSITGSLVFDPNLGSLLRRYILCYIRCSTLRYLYIYVGLHPDHPRF